MEGLRWVLLTLLSTIALAAPAGHAAAQGGPVVLGNADAAGAQDDRGASVSVYKFTNRQGVTSFSDRFPVDRRYQVIEVRTDCFACNLRSTVDWHSTPLQLSAYRQPIDMAASRYGVDPALVRAVIHAESAFKPQAVSRMGAMGLMQLMPGTARDMGVRDPMSPDDNIRGGVRYLAWLMEKNQGSVTLATAAYNAGPGAVERYQGIPPYEETQTYVKRVRILHERYKKALVSSS